MFTDVVKGRNGVGLLNHIQEASSLREQMKTAEKTGRNCLNDALWIGIER